MKKMRRNDRPIRGAAGDKPWFCWFNETVVEFFIYFNKSHDPASTSSYMASGSTSSAAAITAPVSLPVGSAQPSAAASTGMAKRDYAQALPFNTNANYPLPIKFEEKRKPSDNIQPYCQQMQVLDDGRIVTTGGEIIVAENPSTEDATAARKRRMRKRYAGMTGDQLDNYLDEVQPGDCKCEWLTEG